MRRAAITHLNSFIKSLIVTSCQEENITAEWNWLHAVGNRLQIFFCCFARNSPVIDQPQSTKEQVFKNWHSLWKFSWK